jgi:SPX domain protein involved in polyphosphate accumulation
MKFGEELKKQTIYEWKKQYLDYDRLKRLIEEFPNSNEFEGKKKEFIKEFSEQVNKVNKFYLITEKKLSERNSQLAIQIDKYVIPKKLNTSEKNYFKKIKS